MEVKVKSQMSPNGQRTGIVEVMEFLKELKEWDPGLGISGKYKI